MRPDGSADDSSETELEVTPLDQRPASQSGPERGRGARRVALALRRLRDRRWRMALAVCAIALAVIIPLVSLPPTRALFIKQTPTPAPTHTPARNVAITIVTSGNASTDIAPAVWDSLRARPLRLPTIAPGGACPVNQGRVVQPTYGPAVGAGPAYIVGMGTDGVLQATAPTPTPQSARVGAWGSQFAFFIIAPSYQGPVLARGEQLDGSHALLFNGGLDQMAGFDATTPVLLRQLRLEGSPAFGSPWPTFGAYLRMQTAGCYAIQLDGTSFSETIVFRVVFGQ